MVPLLHVAVLCNNFKILNSYFIGSDFASMNFLTDFFLYQQALVCKWCPYSSTRITRALKSFQHTKKIAMPRNVHINNQSLSIKDMMREGRESGEDTRLKDLTE